MSDALKQLAYDLLECYKPFEKCDERRLKEADETIRRYGRFSLSEEELDAITYEIKAVQTARDKRAASGPSFVSNDRVQVIEEILWWNKATSAGPHVGLVGTVIRPSVPLCEQYAKDQYNYAGLVPVRFKAVDLGYEWEEGDDPDWEFVTYNLPNYVLERIG